MNSKIFILLGFLVALAGCPGGTSTGSGGSGATSSDPVSILAPVSGLISISTPTDSGMVRVQGASGAVSGGATVSINNTNVAGLIKGLGVSALTTSGTADAGGAFTIDITGSIGDPLKIIQSLNGETSDTFSSAVHDNNILADNVVEYVTVSPSLNQGYAQYFGDTDSFIDIYDLSDFSLQKTLTLTDFITSDADFHDANAMHYLISAVSAPGFLLVDNNGTRIGDDLNLGATPIFVEVDQTANQALLGFVGDFQSLALVTQNGTNTPSVAGELLITHPTDSNTKHTSTDAISIDYKNGSPKAVVLSRYDNFETIMSFVSLTYPNQITVDAQFNLGEKDLSGRSAFEEIVLLDSASRILLTDRADDKVLVYTIDGTTFTQAGEIAVLDGPIGLVHDEATDKAFVAISEVNSVQELDIRNFTVTETFDTTDGLGLVPTGIAFDNSPLTLMIQNEGSKTVSFIEVK